MDDIKFLRSTEEEKKVKELEEILDVLTLKRRNADVEAARTFFYCLLKSAKQIADDKKAEAARKIR